MEHQKDVDQAIASAAGDNFDDEELLQELNELMKVEPISVAPLSTNLPPPIPTSQPVAAQKLERNKVNEERAKLTLA